jgi:hypothetical protein
VESELREFPGGLHDDIVSTGSIMANEVAPRDKGGRKVHMIGAPGRWTRARRRGSRRVGRAVGRRGCRIGRSDLRQIADFGVRILRTPKIAVFHGIEAILPWFSENGFLGTSEKRRKCRLCCALCAQNLVVVQMRILRI